VRGADDTLCVDLRDGTRAELRPISPEDKWRLRAGMALLSPQARFQRFHAAVNELTDDQLRYLTEIDHRNHLAFVALNPDEPDEPGMGVARCVRIEGEPDVAEAAVTVLDRYQGRGVGTLLLRVLAEAARRQGIRVFRNYVLTENQSMLDVLEALGGQRTDEGDGVVRIDLPLDTDTGESPAMRLLHAVARRVLPPVLLGTPLLGLRRGRADAAEDPPGAERADLKEYLDTILGRTGE
jgi:GNAT superfamily N-acetyltransferase